MKKLKISLLRLKKIDSLKHMYDFDLAEVYRAQRKDEKAEQLYIAGMSRRYPRDGMTELRFMYGLALLRMTQGKDDDANDLLVEASLTGRKQLGDDHPYTLEFINSLGVLRTKQKQYEEAERLFHEAIEGRRLKLGDEHPHTLESLKNLIKLYEAWNKPEKAAQWRAKLPPKQD